MLEDLQSLFAPNNTQAGEAPWVLSGPDNLGS